MLSHLKFTFLHKCQYSSSGYNLKSSNNGKVDFEIGDHLLNTTFNEKLVDRLGN